MSWVGKPTRAALARAEVERWIAAGDARWTTAGGTCDAPTRAANREAGWTTGERCTQPAGLGTTHLGFGSCRQHGGNSKKENTRGAWAVAHGLARALNVTPWEALLGEVRRTAGAVAWLDRKVAEAPTDEALLKSVTDEDGPGYARWVKLRMEERQHLARVSKLAVDAGVARELVAQFSLQGETYARLVTNLLGGLAGRGLGLTEEQERLVDELLHRELLTLEATATEDRVLEGEVVDTERRRR
jgi:hypothetical protein